MSQDKLNFPYKLGHQVADQPCWDPPNGPSHEGSRENAGYPGANTIVPGSPPKKIPIRLLGYERTLNLIGIFLG
jgi:hypothetical protein